MDMLNLVFGVFLTSFITSNHGSTLQNRNVQEIIELLKGQNYNDRSYDKIKESSSDISTDSDDNLKSLRNMDVIDLIEKANRKQKFSELQNRNTKKNNERNILERFDTHRQRDGQRQLQDLNRDHYKKQKRQRIISKNVLGSDDNNGKEHFIGDILNKYSKVLVILDPLALEKSENKNAVNNLVSKILSLSSSTNEKAYPERNKSPGYIGFNVKNNLLSRRYRRDSKETFGRDSLEDYKPKRSRNENGGSGGRTAIPYIRQRGDIYEKDH